MTWEEALVPDELRACVITHWKCGLSSFYVFEVFEHRTIGVSHKKCNTIVGIAGETNQTLLLNIRTHRVVYILPGYCGVLGGSGVSRFGGLTCARVCLRSLRGGRVSNLSATPPSRPLLSRPPAGWNVAGLAPRTALPTLSGRSLFPPCAGGGRAGFAPEVGLFEAGSVPCLDHPQRFCGLPVGVGVAVCASLPRVLHFPRKSPSCQGTDRGPSKC